MRCLYQNAINSVVFVICVHILPRRNVTNIGKEMVACMKEQMTKKRNWKM